MVDLGCGPGQLTATLVDRWPEADIFGLDSSPEMIGAAQTNVRPRLKFEIGDLCEWAKRPDTADNTLIDVIVSNATLQWVPGHVEFFAALVDKLSPNGVFAFQVPGNFEAPSHAILSALRMSDRWRDQVGAGADRHLAVSTPEEYVGALSALGCEVDAWETTYVHILQGEDPVLDWVSGTGLRPVLAALNSTDAAEFTAEYGAQLRVAYPRKAYGTPLEFRRIFVVARRLV